MTARFRMVHFIPDPFMGSRVPIAALVEQAGEVLVAPVAHLPGPECVGGPATSMAIRLAVEDLQRVVKLEHVPASLGPHVVFDEVRAVPASVEDAAKWIQHVVNPPREHAAETRATKDQRLASYGYRFFQNWHVAQYVQKTFKPGQDLGGYLANASALGPVAHYVVGGRDVLLMEPIRPSRSTWHQDTKRVAQLFGAYKSQLDTDKRFNAKLIVYLLGGGNGRVREEASGLLAPFTNSVVDTENARARDELLTQIRDVAMPSSPMLQ